jgi:hypothetical protein
MYQWYSLYYIHTLHQYWATRKDPFTPNVVPIGAVDLCMFSGLKKPVDVRDPTVIKGEEATKAWNSMKRFVISFDLNVGSFVLLFGQVND